jgi:hypothetical protein
MFSFVLEINSGQGKQDKTDLIKVKAGGLDGLTLG